MTQAQLLILGVLVATVAMFLWGRWRRATCASPIAVAPCSPAR
jgi:hypothetical protein